MEHELQRIVAIKMNAYTEIIRVLLDAWKLPESIDRALFFVGIEEQQPQIFDKIEEIVMDARNKLNSEGK